MGSTTMQPFTPRHSSIFNSPKVHASRRIYLVPSDPPFESMASRTIFTRASLPTIRSNTSSDTQETSSLDAMRPASSSSSKKRSVSGMKELLPLKLSSPQIPNLESKSTSKSTRRTTFGQSARLGPLSKSGDGTELSPRLSMSTARYRDTPIFSQSGTLLFGGPLHQESCSKCHQVGCTTSCIIDEYEACSDSSSSTGFSSDYSDRHTKSDAPSVASSSISSERRYRPHSGFSFKCLGEPNHNSGSSWFAKPIKQRVSSRLSTLDIEEWLSDSASSMCEGSDDEGSDPPFTYATALAPAKAHVVQVHHRHSPRLSITIPKQSTATTNFKHSDLSSLEKLTSRSAIKTMSSPPTSPQASSSNEMFNNQQALLSPIPTPASPDTILDIVADIEECTSNFPTKMLLADTPCISSIRSHLKATSTATSTSTSRTGAFKSQQSSAPSSNKTLNSICPIGLNHRKRPQTICLSPTQESHSFTSQILTTPPSTPPYSPNQSISSTLPPKKPNGSSILPTFAYQLAAANLQPLHTIFPISSDFIRSALYAHILAYVFILDLPPNTNTNTHCSPFSSRPHTTFHSARKQSSASTSSSSSSSSSSPFPHSLSSYAYNNTTSLIGIPAKAASTLGLSSSTFTCSRRNLGAATQNKKIELNLRSCIGKLLRGIEGRVDAENGKTDVEGWVLRSLIEVVRGCEGI
ncbi:hypothetical protein DSL72_001886 [Monilinia vaccinii-corymbosi]|uniref:Uncharacterized protein n=1 Tax=Monilinia vaccinii-corymbosi TaxID=61207 RepID=A0A8A3PB26_9HELO|nr:hypothetical protein DSL72_001886 [Monilinia vaccinii-corymbosi]